MSLKMSREEREAFLADLHVGIVSISRHGKAPLTAPIWYDYKPGGKVWMIANGPIADYVERRLRWFFSDGSDMAQSTTRPTNACHQ